MPSLMFRAIVFFVFYFAWCHERRILVYASIGDRLEFYDSCLSYCKFFNCSNDTSHFPYCNIRDGISCENELQMDQATQFYNSDSYFPSVDQCQRWSQWLEAQKLPGLECNFHHHNDGYTFANDDTNDGTAGNLARYGSPITSSSVFGRTSSLSFKDRQPTYLSLLGWSCVEECKYQCQWRTIDFLMSSNVGITWSNIPQFYGKWTFRRILGLQEPASVLFSLFNLLSLLIGWSKYHKKIGQLLSQSKLQQIASKSNNNSQEETTTVPMNQFYPLFHIRNFIIHKYKWLRQFALIDQYYFVNLIAMLLSVNAWISSIIFHTHDLPVTEKMDYLSAFALVLFNLFSALFRITIDLFKLNNNKSKLSNIDTCNNFNSNKSSGDIDGNNILAKKSSNNSTTSITKMCTIDHLDRPKSNLNSNHRHNLIDEKGQNIIIIFDSFSFCTKFFTLLMPFVSFYVYHINYLLNVKFDYGYNMMVNTVAAILATCLIIFWIIIQMVTTPNITSQRVANLKFGIFCILYVNSCFLLELSDFPPIFYASLDPHALWHLTSIPFHFLWFRFLAEEASILSQIHKPQVGIQQETRQCAESRQ